MPLSTRRLRAAFGRWPAAPDGTVRADALLSRSALERLGLRADDAAPRARALALALDGDPEAQHDRLCFDDFAAVVRRLEERLAFEATAADGAFPAPARDDDYDDDDDDDGDEYDDDEYDARRDDDYDDDEDDDVDASDDGDQGEGGRRFAAAAARPRPSRSSEFARPPPPVVVVEHNPRVRRLVAARRARMLAALDGVAPRGGLAPQPAARVDALLRASCAPGFLLLLRVASLWTPADAGALERRGWRRALLGMLSACVLVCAWRVRVRGPAFYSPHNDAVFIALHG